MSFNQVTHSSIHYTIPLTCYKVNIVKFPRQKNSNEYSIFFKCPNPMVTSLPSLTCQCTQNCLLKINFWWICFLLSISYFSYCRISLHSHPLHKSFQVKCYVSILIFQPPLCMFMNPEEIIKSFKYFVFVYRFLLCIYVFGCVHACIQIYKYIVVCESQMSIWDSWLECFPPYFYLQLFH